MTAPASREHPQQVNQERGGVPDEALSPEDLEELEAFRAMAKRSRQVSKEWLDRLITPID
ncbi:MAG TPA: hypothetical protein VEX86_23270 [Longimicrobium sp.]|nr:hypothetical protein [Longimicrobium sp.]